MRFHSWFALNNYSCWTGVPYWIIKILRHVCRSAFIFCIFSLTMEKSRAELHEHIVWSLFNTAMSWWKGRAALVALKLLWGLKITGCQAVWLFFFPLLWHIFLWWACCVLQTVTFASLKLSFFAGLSGDLLQTILFKKKKKITKKRVSLNWSFISIPFRTPAVQGLLYSFSFQPPMDLLIFDFFDL